MSASWSLVAPWRERYRFAKTAHFSGFCGEPVEFCPAWRCFDPYQTPAVPCEPQGRRRVQAAWTVQMPTSILRGSMPLSAIWLILRNFSCLKRGRGRLRPTAWNRSSANVCAMGLIDFEDRIAELLLSDNVFAWLVSAHVATLRTRRELEDRMRVKGCLLGLAATAGCQVGELVWEECHALHECV